MADEVTVWFDAGADYLEVQFKCVPGYMKETTHASVFSASVASPKTSLSKLNSPPRKSIRTRLFSQGKESSYVREEWVCISLTKPRVLVTLLAVCFYSNLSV